jgi:chaperonin GroES
VVVKKIEINASLGAGAEPAAGVKHFTRVDLKPLGRLVMVLPDEKEKKSRGGLWLPDQSQDRPTLGTVLAVGDEAETCVKAGDRVVFARWQGTDVEYDDVTVRFVKDDDLLALVC